MKFSGHVPVLVETLVRHVDIQANNVVIDCTLGLGGHSCALIEHFACPFHLIGIDQDPDAQEIARERLSRIQKQHPSIKVDIVQNNFEHIDTVCKTLGITGAHLILADLGVSSLQLDTHNRGFSFKYDAPLDMRMNPKQGIPVSEWLAGADEKEIADVLWKYGEEKFSRKIAKAIGEQRKISPIQTTTELANLIEQVYPKQSRSFHPARKSFQALRIMINRELEVLETFLPKAFDLLVPGGYLAVISFHSGEDRIVKMFMKERSEGCTCPPEFPHCVCHKRASAKVFKKFIPTTTEIVDNPRSRSAILRICQKI